MKFWLVLETPGTYRISAEACEGAPDVSLELLDADMAVLASAVSGAGCPSVDHASVDHELAQPGTYALRSSRAADVVVKSHGASTIG